MTFNDRECYELFLAVDDRARQLEKPSNDLLYLRERLRPIYIERHKTQSGVYGP
jgi:hypothetical protein